MTQKPEGGKRFVSVQSEIEDRVFTVDLLRLSNGCFANVAEGANPRLGAITISIKSQQGVNSSTLIPDPRGRIFARTLGELITERTEGIAVISLYLRAEVDSEITKLLLAQVSKLLAEIDGKTAS